MLFAVLFCSVSSLTGATCGNLGTPLIILKNNRKCYITFEAKKYRVMGIVRIEPKTFEAMLSKFEGFAKRTEHYFCLHGDKDMSEWLDNQDVCQLLNISPRTLQTLRDNGTLAYSQISHKTYYKPEDVNKILPLVEDRKKQAAYKGKILGNE